MHLGEHRTWLSQELKWRREGEACMPVSKLAATCQLLLATFFVNCGCQVPVFPLLFRIVQVNIASRKQNFNQDFVFRSLFSLKLLIKSCKITSKQGNCRHIQTMAVSSLIVLKKSLEEVKPHLLTKEMLMRKFPLVSVCSTR